MFTVNWTDLSEHPIHPPKDLHNDPWDCEFLDDCGYIPSIVDGVYQLFANEDDLKAGKRYFRGHPYSTYYFMGEGGGWSKAYAVNKLMQ